MVQIKSDDSIGEKYCKGIVFMLSDTVRKKDDAKTEEA